MGPTWNRQDDGADPEPNPGLPPHYQLPLAPVQQMAITAARLGTPATDNYKVDPRLGTGRQDRVAGTPRDRCRNLDGPTQPRPFGPVTVAKAYRLMHAIMTTAVDDGLVHRNPRHITGAGREHSDERPVIPVSTLVALLDNVPTRYRALLLLATFANLRFGELAGLRRNQLDLDACEVRVTASTWERGNESR
jgi:hypothetical protein